MSWTTRQNGSSGLVFFLRENSVAWCLGLFHCMSHMLSPRLLWPTQGRKRGGCVAARIPARSENLGHLTSSAWDWLPVFFFQQRLPQR